MKRIVCLGDSLTSGHGIGTAVAYPAVLHQRVRRAGFPYEVVNAGVSRETSAQARARLDRALDGDVRVLVVALGANDGLRGVPVAQLTVNLSHIIEVAQKRGISVLLCGMEALPIYGWPYATAFHQAYLDLAARYKVPLVPFIPDERDWRPAPDAAGSRPPERRGRARDRRRHLAISRAYPRLPPHLRVLASPS